MRSCARADAPGRNPWDGEPEDQVLRKRRRETANPEVEIVPPGALDGQWAAHHDGTVLVTGNHLRDVLDDLDDIYGDRP